MSGPRYIFKKHHQYLLYKIW